MSQRRSKSLDCLQFDSKDSSDKILNQELIKPFGSAILRRKRPALTGHFMDNFTSSHLRPTTIFSNRLSTSTSNVGSCYIGSNKASKSQIPKPFLPSSDNFLLQRASPKLAQKHLTSSSDCRQSTVKTNPFNTLLIPSYLTFPGVEAGLDLNGRDKVYCIHIYQFISTRSLHWNT